MRVNKMECLQVTAWDGTLEQVEREVPTPGKGEVLVEVEATSVGLTVKNAIHGRLGDNPANLPRIPGHEIVGEVVELGEGVTNVDVGNSVAAYFYLTCGRCDACLAAHEPLCENHRGFVGVDIDGGYAEYVTLPAENAIPLPNGVDPVAATAIPDAIGTPYHVANQRAQIEPGDDIAVLGAGGGVGIHLMQVAQYFGGRVTAVDQRDEKLDRCADLGAVHTVDTRHRSVSTAAAEFGLEYDAIVDFTGATDLVEDAVTSLAPRGRFVHLTAFADQTMAVSPRVLVRGEQSVLGSRYCSKFEFRRSAELVADGVVDPVVTEVVDLEGVSDLLETIAMGDHTGRGAVVPP